MLKTDYLQLKKPELTDLADINVINDNMDIIDNKVMEVEAEAKNKNGGDAKTVGGKSAEELQNYNNLTNKPLSLPADGGNADTVGNKTAEELQNYNNLTNKPTSLPANGGNADTVGGKSAEEFYNKKPVRISATTNPTTLSNGIYAVEGSLSTDNGYPVNTESGNVIIYVYGQEFGEYGYHIIKYVSIYNDQYIKFQQWDSWTNWISLKDADTLGGKNADDFYNREPITISNTTNPITLDSGIYSVEGELSTDNGYPFNASWLHALIYVSGGKASDYGYRVIRYESIYNDHYIKFQRWNSWSDWFSLRDAQTISGKTVSQLQDYNNLTNTPSSLPANGGNADTVGGRSAEDFFNAFTVSNASVDGLGTKTGFFKVASSGISGVSFSVGKTSIDAADGNSYDVEIFCRLWGVYGEKLLVRYDVLYLDDNSWEQGTAKRLDDDFLLKNGDGSGLTNVNAVTLGGKTVSQLQNYNNLTNTPSSLPANGGDAQTVNKVTKTFTVQTGSWFRFAKCKNALASGVFVLAVNSNNGHSSTSTISVSQTYSLVNTSQSKITSLSHSSFNTCVTKVRLDTKYGDNVEQYIDFYLEGGSDNSTGNVTVQFFGQGWEICDIESNNVITDYTTQEITL